jgi:hypothetical protein
MELLRRSVQQRVNLFTAVKSKDGLMYVYEILSLQEKESGTCEVLESTVVLSTLYICMAFFHVLKNSTLEHTVGIIRCTHALRRSLTVVCRCAMRAHFP